jgi:hypothetical protein
MSDSGSESARHHPYKTRAPSRAGTPPGLSDSDLLVYAALKELLYHHKHADAILALPPGPECNSLAKQYFPKVSTTMSGLSLFAKFFSDEPTTPEKCGIPIPTDPVTPTPQRIATPNPVSTSYEVLFDDERQQLYQHLLEGLFPHPLAFFILDGPEETVVDCILERYYQLTRSHISTLTGLFPAFANYQSQKRQEAEFMRQETLISPQPDLVPVEDIFSAYHSPAPPHPQLASPAHIPSPVRHSQSVSLDA